ncbi:hypothetical protein OOU_Y34scaffold00185g1, partial [Pyricularia oryzae Y34]
LLKRVVQVENVREMHPVATYRLEHRRTEDGGNVAAVARGTPRPSRAGFLDAVVQASPKRVRLSSPDELESNKHRAILDHKQDNYPFGSHLVASPLLGSFALPKPAHDVPASLAYPGLELLCLREPGGVSGSVGRLFWIRSCGLAPNVSLDRSRWAPLGRWLGCPWPASSWSARATCSACPRILSAVAATLAIQGGSPRISKSNTY